MIVVYLLISTKHGKTSIVSTALSKYDELIDIHEVYGRYDIIARLETESQATLRKFIQNKLRITEGIARTEILIVSEEFSDEPDDDSEETEEDISEDEEF